MSSSYSTEVMQAHGPGSLGQFKTRTVNPIIPFFTMLYFRAQRILMLARDSRGFHMLNIYIARQALHLVILLNDLAYAEDGLDGQQMDEREVLADELVELEAAMREWSTIQGFQDYQDTHSERSLTIKTYYNRFFRKRFYFENSRDPENDTIYQRLLAYDTRGTNGFTDIPKGARGLAWDAPILGQLDTGARADPDADLEANSLHLRPQHTDISQEITRLSVQGYSPSSDSSDATPTAASLKSRPHPPGRSPFQHSLQPSPRRHGASDHPLPPAKPLPVIANDDMVPIPRQGKADSDAARARRREAYKSGMSFVSLYELYTEPPALPIPPVPSLDRANLAPAPGSVGHSRSVSTVSGSMGAGRERKTLLHGSTSTSNAPTIHGNTRIGSTGASPMRSANQIPRLLPASSVEQSGSLGLANATIPSSVPNLGEQLPATRSKRQHVLFEILETERIYSSDMALVKAVHLPLALGLKIDFGSVSLSTRSSTDPTVEANGPPRSSGISTASSSQSQSGSGGYPTNSGLVAPEPPMSVEDAKVIFANLDELAEFTGRFTEFIHLALGSEIDDGVGQDKVGGLFLEMLPIMGPIYETYITKHSASIARLTALTTENPTPAMISYIDQTKAVALTHSNSWDLNSLLKRPIQHFLKYSLLLEALVMSTPDTHPEKFDLRRAKTAMVEAGRLINQQTQKVEICRTILQRKPLRGLSAVFSANNPNSQQLKVKGSKSVFAVTKAKDVPPNPTRPSSSVTPFDVAFDPIPLENRILEHAGGGAGGLEQLIHHLQGFETLIPHYVRDIVHWVRSVRETLIRLENWAIAFERVITLDDSGGIEALDAFKAVLTDRLSPILDGLETAVRIILVPTLGKIQDSMKGPTLLLNTAASLRTVHNQFMNTPYIGKTNRLSPQVVEGSKTYLALMQQLRTDLPVYVRHLDRMFGFVTLEVVKWQERWYREVGQGWSDLWTALDIGPGSRKEYRRHKELSAEKKSSRHQSNLADTPEDLQHCGAYGCNGEEIAAIWWDRWEGVNLAVAALGVPSGAALQGVRSLQGLIKHPPAAVSGVHYPLEAPEPTYSTLFNEHVIHEGAEDEGEEDFFPPGYYPTSPSFADRRTSRLYAPSRDSTSTQDVWSLTQSGSSGVYSRRIGSVMSEYSPSLVPTLDSIWPTLPGDDAPIIFTCKAVAVFTPKEMRYSGLPFLALDIGDLVDIIKDAGRPAQHPQLEPVVSDGVDTLFIGRKLPVNPEAEAEVGWLWASFVMPLEG